MEEIHAHSDPDGAVCEPIQDPHARLVLRKNILRRAAKAGAYFSKAATNTPERRTWRTRLHLRWISLRPGVAFASGVVLTLASGGLVLQQRAARRSAVVESLRPSTNNIASQNAGYEQSGGTLPPAPRESAAREAKLELALAQAQTESERLLGELKELRSKTAQFEADDHAATDRITQLEDQLARAAANESRVQAELVVLRGAEVTAQSALAAKEREVQDLNARFEEQSAGIERESQLLSKGKEIRDIVAARNLHIIDVYDTDAKGKTKKAFGRVFYTEGKSLLFYAYDLPAHRAENANYDFYAWGKSDGNREPVRSLGLLYSDDQSQKRWVLNITDPRVLAQIDSVFITLERTDSPGNRPTGKEILSAYLHSPANHP
jgi:hypothetical protein